MNIYQINFDHIFFSYSVILTLCFIYSCLRKYCYVLRILKTLGDSKCCHKEGLAFAMKKSFIIL